MKKIIIKGVEYLYSTEEEAKEIFKNNGIIIKGYFYCGGDFRCNGNFDCVGNFNCVGNFYCDGNSDCGGDFSCDGNFYCGGYFYCSGNFYCGGDFSCNGYFSCYEDFYCDGNFSCSEDFYCNGNFYCNGYFYCDGKFNCNHSIFISAIKFKGDVIISDYIYFPNYYFYKANLFKNKVDNVWYLTFGCFTRTLQEWESDFWNNEKEFPNDNSEKSNARYKLFQLMKQNINFKLINL